MHTCLLLLLFVFRSTTRRHKWWLLQRSITPRCLATHHSTQQQQQQQQYHSGVMVAWLLATPGEWMTCSTHSCSALVLSCTGDYWTRKVYMLGMIEQVAAWVHTVVSESRVQSTECSLWKTWLKQQQQQQQQQQQHWRVCLRGVITWHLHIATTERISSTYRI